MASCGERDAFTARGEQANIFDGFFSVAIVGLIADDQVVALLALQDLAYGFASDSGFYGVLHVGDVDAVAGGLLAVDRNIQIGLAEDAEEAEIFNAGDAAHYVDDFVAFFFEDLQIVAVEFYGQLAFYAADGFFHVVRDGLREIPEDAGHFA